MTNTKTIKELAQEVLNNMETKKRDNGDSFVCLKSHDTQWHVDLCQKAHNGIMPNDFVYDEIENSLYRIIEAGGETAEEIRENVFDSNVIEPEIYNDELLRWVSSNLAMADYVDEALQELEPKGLFEALQYGNQQFKEEIFNSVLDSLENQQKK